MTQEGIDHLTDFRRHMDRVMMGVAGGFITLAIGAVGWEMNQEQRLTTVTATVAENTRARLEAAKDRAEIRQHAAMASREVGGLSVKIDGQKQTLEQIRDDLLALRQFLQKEGNKQ